MPPVFRCPLCKSEFFDRVDVPRANGMLYQTPFFRCGGCSVMFLDPGRFTESRPRLRGDEFAPARQVRSESSG